MSSIQRVLVTGGAGFLGRRIVDRLLSQGRQVVVLDRAEHPTAPGVETVIGDIRDEATLRAACRDVHAVIHAAFAPPQADHRELAEVNVDAVERVLAAGVEAGTDRVVVVSSTIVERRPRTHPLAKAAPLSRLDEYRRTRAAGEAVAEAWSSRITVSVARPCTFLGPGRVGAFALLFEAVRSGAAVPILGPGTNRYQLVQVDDLAEGLVLLAEADHPGLFHFGARRAGTVVETLERLAHRAATGARVIRVPGPLARVAVRGLELGALPPLSDWHQATARQEDRLHDITQAVRAGWSPHHDNDDALWSGYEWYAGTRASGWVAATTHPVPRTHALAASALSVAARLGASRAGRERLSR